MPSLRRPFLLASLASLLLLGTVAASPAAAAESPWWGLNTSVRPATIAENGEGTIVAVASNLGNADTSGRSTVSLTLPAGVSVLEEGGTPKVRFLSFAGGKSRDFGPKLCSLSGQTVTCRAETAPPGAYQKFIEERLEEFGFTPPFEPEIIALGEEVFPRAAFEESEGFLEPLAPYEFLELRVKVKDEGAGAGATYEAEAAGGGAATPVHHTRPLPIGPNPPAFGAEAYELRPEVEGGATDARAGAHPYQLTATFNLNQNAEGEDENLEHPPALARNLAFALPPGQIGNAQAVAQCSTNDFNQVAEGGFENLCAPDTAIGVASITFFEPTQLGLSTYPIPLFNLTPAFGEPARFGFVFQQTPVILDTSVRSGKPGTPEGDYGVTVAARNTTQLANFISSTVTFWGTPGEASHDISRGWPCLVQGHWSETGRQLPCEPLGQANPPAFLTLPTDCASPFLSTASGESWTDPEHLSASAFGPFSYSLEDGAGHLLPLSACNQLPFDPHIHSEPTSDSATSPTGMSFDVNFEDEGLTRSKPGARAQSQLKRAVVTLPQGFTTNPSVAEGLKACTEAEYEAATLETNSGCNGESKVGEVTVQSPLVQPNQIVRGGLYVARQGLNPNHNLLTLYLIAREPEIGVLIRQALKVTPDPVTGQLTTEVDNIPELPFSHFHLEFRSGQRSPLITPPACGNYTVKADLYPWSNPSAPVHEHKSFQITQGPEGGPCPSGGVPPFHPNLEAGTINNAAGTYSPFYAHITRKDSEQEITHFSIKLPPGVIGKLAGIPFCPDAGIAAAKAREHEGGGQEELNSPSCPAASEVGHTLVGTGVGNVLAYAPGKLYLAGPYNGAPISIVSITAAKVGPFDLGTVVVREALKVNPETAEVFVDATGSDPIPHIVDGIPVHLRDIRIYVNRPEFVLNPTSCEPTSTASTVLGSGLNFASAADDVPVTVTSRFQAADCAALPFGPQLSLKLLGATKRTGHPRLKATLRMNGVGEAAIARSQVTLPKSEFLDQGHLNNICTRVQFKEGGGNGEKCPPASVYGHARAVTPILSEPLEGPVYLRSSEHKLPDLVAALHGQEINIDLVGRIDSFHGPIRTTFEAVPDAPVESFTLEMQGGAKGLLINSTNLCEGTHKAIVDFTAHNGKLHDSTPAVGARCHSHKHKSHKRHRAKRRH